MTEWPDKVIGGVVIPQPETDIDTLYCTGVWEDRDELKDRAADWAREYEYGDTE